MIRFKNHRNLGSRFILRYNLLRKTSQITQDERSAKEGLPDEAHGAKAGVTLFEVLITIFLIGSLLTPAFLLQSNLLTAIAQWSRSLRSVLQLRETLVHTAQDRLLGKKHPKEQTKGPITITYDMAKPKKESALAKLESLYIERASSEWGQEKETVVSVLYKPEVPKK